MTLTRLTPIDGETILPLEDAKAAARITSAREDTTLAALRDAALSEIERKSGIALAESEWRWTANTLPCRVALPMRPVSAVGDVVYLDSDGAEQTYADARLVNGYAQAAAGGSWPSVYGYAAVEFTAGPPAANDLSLLIAAAQIQFQILENRGRDDQKYIDGMRCAVRSMLDTITPVLV